MKLEKQYTCWIEMIKLISGIVDTKRPVASLAKGNLLGILDAVM